MGFVLSVSDRTPDLWYRNRLVPVAFPACDSTGQTASIWDPYHHDCLLEGHLQEGQPRDNEKPGVIAMRFDKSATPQDPFRFAGI